MAIASEQHLTLMDLAARLTAAERELVALRGPARATPRPAGRRRRGIAIAAILLALLVALPSSLLATGFVDLNPGSIHNPDISAIADAGITKGCTDAQHYCPNDHVTREQMASFLARSAGLGGNPPVANARTLEGYAPGDLLRAALGTGKAVDTLTLSEQTIATVEITAPQAGYLLVSGVMQSKGPQSGCPCTVLLRLKNVKTGESSSYSTAYTQDNNVFNSGATTYLFAVEAGPQTIALRSQLFSGNGTVEVNNGRLTALYVPFGPDGAVP